MNPPESVGTDLLRSDGEDDAHNDDDPHNRDVVLYFLLLSIGTQQAHIFWNFLYIHTTGTCCRKSCYL